MNWRSNNQDYSTIFGELKNGDTFFFDDDEPYLKISDSEAFSIERNSIFNFEKEDLVDPCTHELILRC